MTTQNRFGITVSAAGDFVFVGMKRSHGAWKVGSVRSWSSSAPLRNYLLLGKAVNLALPCRWIRVPPGESDTVLSAATSSSFTAYGDRLEHEQFTTLLENNCAAVYPDDAALLTLPRSLVDGCAPTFLTILRDHHAIRVGIIINTTLVTVATVAADSWTELEGQIGRIERYFALHLHDTPFPQQWFTLNAMEFPDEPPRAVVDVPCGSDDPEVIKAAGCALCDTGTNVPLLGGASKALNFRLPRSLLFHGSYLALLCVLVLAGALFVASHRCGNRLDAARENYRSILAGNVEILSLIAEGDSLAARILRSENLLANPTRWAPFLHRIGAQRPPGLYLEKLGSEPVAGSTSTVRIALAGWCETETIATDFIKILLRVPDISEPTLTSIERAPGETTACRFRIVCMLSLSDG